MAKLKPIRILLCYFGNAVQEVQIAAQIIEDWNGLHGERFGVMVKHQYSSNVPQPDLRKTPWGMTTKQLVERAQLLITISRLRPDAASADAESGMVKAPRRHIARGEYSIVFISDLELVADGVDGEQEPRVKLRESYYKNRAHATFQLRARFKRMFATDLSRALNKLLQNISGRRTPLKKLPAADQLVGMP